MVETRAKRALKPFDCIVALSVGQVTPTVLWADGPFVLHREVPIAAADRGRLLVCDPQTGVVTARISSDPAAPRTFAHLVADAGDLNGDGVHDFAIGAPGYYGNGLEGRIYFLDGRVATPAGADA